MIRTLLVFPCLLAFLCSFALAQQQPRPANEPRVVPWNEAEFVFTGKLEGAVPGPTALSFPPIHNHTLALTIDKVLRGSLKAGEKVEAHHAARQQVPPVLPVGKQVVVAASKAEGGLRVQRIEEFDEQKLKEIERACELPIGWRIEGDKIVSPWAALGKEGWKAESDLKAKLACSATGRPALLAGPGLKLTAEHVPPAKNVQFANPDGDGEYKITLTNTTDKPLVVPALLSDGKQILWDESLVILCQGKAYPCPGAKGVSGNVTSTTLRPGESVSTIVNVLRLDGPTWPMGGYRLEFQFCLGELSQAKSFYYLTRHHGPIREGLKKE